MHPGPFPALPPPPPAVECRRVRVSVAGSVQSARRATGRVASAVGSAQSAGSAALRRECRCVCLECRECCCVCESAVGSAQSAGSAAVCVRVLRGLPRVSGVLLCV